MNFKLIFATLSITFFLAGCGQQELKNLKISNHHLKSENSDLLADVESYIKTINEIENNLADIKERENLISLNNLGDVPLEEDNRNSILEDIRTINDLMAENQNKISELENRLADSNSEFKKMVNRLSKKIKEKDGEIAELRETLKSKNIETENLSKQVTLLAGTVDTLTQSNQRKDLALETSEGIIKEKDQLLNTGFFTIGTRKDLKLNKVIENEGGVLGLGSIQQLKNNFNREAFREIDIRMTSVIPIDTKKLKLITNHPKDSYKLFFNDKEDKIEALEITKPEEFWNSSKYLVVMTTN